MSSTSFAIRFSTPSIEGSLEESPFEPKSIELLSFDIGLERSAAAGGRLAIKELTLIKAMDTTSAQLMLAMVGDVAITAKLMACMGRYPDAGTPGRPHALFTIEGAHIAKVDWDGRLGDQPVETIVLRFAAPATLQMDCIDSRAPGATTATASS